MNLICYLLLKIKKLEGRFQEGEIRSKFSIDKRAIKEDLKEIEVTGFSIRIFRNI